MALTGVDATEPLELTHEDYSTGKLRRFGAANPEVMDIKLLRHAIITGESAYSIRARFAEDFSYDETLWMGRAGVLKYL